MRYLPPAEAELFVAASYYEEQDSGLGLRFLDTVDRAAAWVVENPLASPVVLLRGVRTAVRRRRLQPFPYAVLYVVEPDLLVVAIAHERRRPGYWMDRVP